MGDMAGPRRQTDREIGHRSAAPLEFGQVIVRAAANSRDLEGLTRPLLEAFAKLSGLESTYLTIFDWDLREQHVRFVYSTGSVQVSEGMTFPLPEGLSNEG